MHRVMKFTSDGRAKYRELLGSIKHDGKLTDGFEQVLTLPRFVEKPHFKAELPVDPSWETRFDFATDCYEAFGQEAIRDYLYDGGLWDWIVARYFTKFCKIKSDGSFNAGAWPTLFLKAETWNRYYRHHAAGPIFACQAHPNNGAAALVVLANPLDTPGELAEQLLSRQDVLTSYSSIGAATLLYVDPSTLTAVSGAASKNSPGTSRRYGLYLKQLELTYDLGSMTPVELLRMLPDEYSNFVENFEQWTTRVYDEVDKRHEIDVRRLAHELETPAFFVESAVEWLELEGDLETIEDMALIV